MSRRVQVMLCNVALLALDAAPSLPAHLELLEAFQLMAKRDAVRCCVAKATSGFWELFITEVNAVKKVGVVLGPLGEGEGLKMAMTPRDALGLGCRKRGGRTWRGRS